MFSTDFDNNFNRRKLRNLNNTERQLFNCAGYALGTFSWYCPHENREGNYYSYAYDDRETAWRKTMQAVIQMLQDFNNLRVIQEVSELKKGEYAIAFRIAADGDFHYVRRTRFGLWYHKKGATKKIWRMPKSEVFSDCWCSRYRGPMILFAMKN